MYMFIYLNIWINQSKGDKEKELGLPYSPLCDRNTTLVAESQIGMLSHLFDWNNKVE